MPDLVLRLTDEMAAHVREAAAREGYPDAEAFLQALVMDHHAARMAQLRAMIEAEGAGSIEALREAARRRYREA